jgi:DNA-directed RNA polymerase beta subunit
VARVRDEQQGPALGQGRPQAQDRGDDPPPRGRLRGERRDRGAVHRRRRRPGPPVHRRDPRQGPDRTQAEALIEVYKKLRPGDPPTGDNARQLVESLFFNFRRYDLGRVGRYKFNKKLDPVAARLGVELPRDGRTITREDIAAIVGHLIECNRGLHPKDDIDHLGNRRIRANGELIQNAFRIGLLRMERVVRERMTIQELDKATPNALINIRPVVAAMKEFFGGSQLSQFMDQTNPLAELTSKRRSRPSGRAACRASAPGSTSATSTTATTAASARSRPRKARTSA